MITCPLDPTRVAKSWHRAASVIERGVRGAHGVAGILAWPGRHSRKLGRELPLATQGRDDGGTDYFMGPAVAELFAAGRQRVQAATSDRPRMARDAPGTLPR